MSGCAGAAGVAAGSPMADGTEQATALAQIQERAAEQATRIAELEARLGLLERESQRLRQETPPKPIDTVRIGSHRREAEETDQPPPPPPRLVRLHEPDMLPEDDQPLVMPTAPVGVTTRIPVVALPERRAALLVADGPDALASERESYRAALRYLKERKWDESVHALSEFLVEHPASSLAGNAMYWRGEAYYAQRRYDDAIAEFQSMLARFPAGDKAADSTLKVGLCHLRRGDQAQAKRFFKQVLDQYPSSDAARIASREGAT